MITVMPNCYEFWLDEMPIARMMLPFILSNNDMAGIKLTLANRYDVSIDRIAYQFESVNISDDSSD